MIAKVTVTSPLTVRLPGDLLDTPATDKSDALGAVSIGDDVLVEVVQRRVIVTHRLVAA